MSALAIRPVASLPVFAAACVVVSFAWDVVFSAANKAFHLEALPVPLAVFVFPIFLCAALGRFMGQWRRSDFTRVGVAAWCVVSPTLGFLLLLLTAAAVSRVLR